MTMKSIDELIEYIEAQRYISEDMRYEVSNDNPKFNIFSGEMRAYDDVWEKAQELKANVEADVVEIPCEKCGALWKFDKRSGEARGIYHFVCSDEKCMNEILF